MKKILTLILYIITIQNINAQKYTKKYIKEANKIGLEWWGNVNNHEFEAAYNQLADEIKKQTSLKDWSKQMSRLMFEFGENEQRNVKETYFKSEIDGLNDGFYVIIQYSVMYSKTRNHTEGLLIKQSDKFIWEILEFDYSFQSLKKDN